MLVAITGGSGLIGSYTCKALHAAGHEVRALVRATTRRDDIEPYVTEFLIGEQHDPQSQAGLVAGAQVVIHSAMDWVARKQSPVNHFKNNVLGSLTLMEAARQAGVEQFMLVSSISAYDEILKDRKLDENHPTWPADIYGACKAATEAHIKSYHYEFEMNTSAWRPAAVYGIDPKLEKSQWFDLIKTAKQGGTIDTAHGDKITNVQDVADALTLAIGDSAVSGQFYNLVDGYMYWQGAAELAKDICGSNATVIDRTGDGPENSFDTSKAIEFFNRHGNSKALRRGVAGVQAYVKELLGKM